ncbi:hypothetical protein B0H63DRAFT_443254 [Podospora didyma]|uniref:Phosphoribosylaminoimidazole-succinocarboxamide synthase n=1 Tax=Podospora didyma TaxID=330526 RepID=A0AAE0P459_9PEZI|nr:hypothetical protein B0H63DRAFT_443254 [Podospora didyma]
MNFQNLNFDYVEPARPHHLQHLADPRTRPSSSGHSDVTLRAPGRNNTHGYATTSSQPSTVIPYAPTPPRLSLPSPSSSEPELYGPDRHLGAPVVARAYARPVIVDGPFRRVPSLPPSSRSDPPAWEASLNAAMLTDFRDGLARLAGVVTPGVDDTPYIQYAIEALTRDRDRDTGYSVSGSSSSEGGTPPPRFIPGQEPSYYQPYPVLQQQQPRQSEYEHGQQPHTPMPIPLPGRTSLPNQPPAVHTPAEQAQEEDPRHYLEPLDPFGTNPRVSADSLASTLMKGGKRPVQPNEWKHVERDVIVATIGHHKAHEVPTLDFKPRALRTPSLMGLVALCIAMLAALICCAVYSELHRGLLPYVSIYGGQYFLFRMLPQLLAAILLFYAQFIITTVFRTIPFVRLASNHRDERDGALFQDLYPDSFLWPQLIGTWNVWVPILATWLINFTIPLQSSLFTVIWVDGQWMWATVQGVAWSLVALYLVLLASTVVVWRYWAGLKNTGLIWDPRSLADIAAIVSETNTSEDYRGTQLARTRDGIRFALRRRASDRLGYWTWKDGKPGFWYTLGSPMDGNAVLVPVLDPKSGMRMERHDKKGVMTGADGGLLDAGDADIEAAGLTTQARDRYLPWCLRTSQLLYFVVTAFVLLVALFVVSFLPSTRITPGFIPALEAAPKAGAFSAADFLYSFLPSLLGMIVFLLFQSLDIKLRILQPWAALSNPRGARAEQSLLADYAACAPIQSSIHALKNGHWRVAVISLLSTLFILIPILAGGTFMALISPDSVVRMFPNVPAFAVVLTLLVLYYLALLALIPARKDFRLPHSVTSLAEVVGFLANEDLLNDLSFKQCTNRDEMLSKLGIGRGVPEMQPRWMFSVGTDGSGTEVLGVRRARRFTEKRRVRKSQIRRGQFRGATPYGGR